MMYPDFNCIKYIMDNFAPGDDLFGHSYGEMTEEIIAFNAGILSVEGYIRFDLQRITVVTEITSKGKELRAIVDDIKLFSIAKETLSGFRNITVDIFVATANNIRNNI